MRGDVWSSTYHDNVIFKIQKPQGLQKMFTFYYLFSGFLAAILLILFTEQAETRPPPPQARLPRESMPDASKVGSHPQNEEETYTWNVESFFN